MYAISTINKRGETVKKVFIFIMVIVSAAVVAVRINQFINPPPVDCPVDSVVAQQGDTIWKIDSAAGCTGGYDKQDRVGTIIDHNGGSAEIMPGQLIKLPQDK